MRVVRYDARMLRTFESYNVGSPEDKQLKSKTVYKATDARSVPLHDSSIVL
jgi:hypothetical protein